MGRKILIADDSASLRHMVQLTLTDAGYEVVDARDGLEALEYARHNSADLVLTDVYMPGMDGISLVRELRALPAFANVPILMLTTETSAERKALGKEAGATGWLIKPFNKHQLIATIDKVI